MRLLFSALLPLVLAGSGPGLIARVATPRAPCGVGSGYRAVWVATAGGGTVSRIDPATNRVTRSVSVGRSACPLAVGAGAVWTLRYGAGELVRVDPGTLRLGRVKVGQTPSTSWSPPARSG